MTDPASRLIEAAFRAEFGEDPWILSVEWDSVLGCWVVDSLLLNTRARWRWNATACTFEGPIRG